VSVRQLIAPPITPRTEGTRLRLKQVSLSSSHRDCVRRAWVRQRKAAASTGASRLASL
jgi:hypothetical protein